MPATPDTAGHNRAYRKEARIGTMYTNTVCPQCGGYVENSDSGEPDCIPGWWCPECEEFFTDGQFNELWENLVGDQELTEMYGYPPAGLMPEDFRPDYELCSADEIARWKSDLKTHTPHRSGTGWNEDRTIHVLAPSWGIGIYKIRDQDKS